LTVPFRSMDPVHEKAVYTPKTELLLLPTWSLAMIEDHPIAVDIIVVYCRSSDAEVYMYINTGILDTASSSRVR
jgi:hypothetical protein